LTAHGVDQAKDLAAHLATVNPPIEQVYSSPYYRCLQTVEPFVNLEQGSSGDPRQGQQRQQQEAADGKTKFRIRAETGLGEWYGSAPFEHPRPAGLPVLRRLFPRSLDVDYRPIARPTGMGESIAELHDRVAATMEGIVARCDRDGTRAILICSHAATVIALGRVLTGNMPDDVEVEDFRAFTCGLSVYRRREAATVAPSPMLHKDDGADSSGGLVAQDGLLVQQQQQQQQQEQQEEQYSLDPDGGSVGGSSGNNKNSMAAAARTLVNDDGRFPSDERKSHADPIRAGGDPPHGQAKDWRGGVGVAGGWLCLVNSECSFLKGGEERGWYVEPLGLKKKPPRLTPSRQSCLLSCCFFLSPSLPFPSPPFFSLKGCRTSSIVA